jgi:ABC-2 type transport system ATP-binding protein
MASPSAVVEVESLRVSRGLLEVLHGLSFEIDAGGITGLIGPSGCGKTTLMRSLVGVQRNVSGRLRLLGSDAGDPALRGR